MTLEQAVAVLNERRHRDCADWRAASDGSGAFGRNFPDSLYAFEAIAIAEKYTRESRSELMPESQRKLVQLAPGGDWCDPAEITMVLAHEVRSAFSPYEVTNWSVAVKFGDNSYLTFPCESEQPARELRDRIAALRNAEGEA
jgi:hypothetical protein